MRTFLIIAAIVLLLVLGYLYIKKIWGKISFVFTFKGIDLGNIDLTNLTGTNAKIRVGLKVMNDNNFAIPFRKVRAWMYYENTLIAQTSEDLSAKTFEVPANGVIEVEDSVNTYINSASLRLIKEIVNKTNPAISYKIKINVFGIPFSYSDYFLANQQP